MTSEQEYARRSLQQLVAHVRDHQSGLIEPIFYSELAFRIERFTKHGDGHGHGVGRILGVMGHMLQEVEIGWGEPIPHIQSLVVNKAGALKGLPDEGIKEFWDEYPQLTRQEKANKANSEYRKIVAFGTRWDAVLQQLDLIPVDAGLNNTAGGSGGSKESERHKALKEFVRCHPEILGANSEYEGIVEYAFPTLDQIDVLLKSESRWIGAEVKSSVSDSNPKDYERGIFQAVKYTAVLLSLIHI